MSGKALLAGPETGFPYTDANLIVEDCRKLHMAPLEELVEQLPKIMEQMQDDMYQRALKFRDEHTYDALDYEEFQKTIAEKPGFVRAMWCGDQACELKIKEDTTATSRCMPFEQENLAEVCVCCSKPAKKMVYWGRAY